MSLRLQAEPGLAVVPRDHNLAVDILQRLFAPLPTQEPFDWCVEHVWFDEPQVRGRFDPVGREYMREQINNINNPDVHQTTKCEGTGCGKTIELMCELFWAMIHEPFRGLYVMPSKEGEGGAREFNNTRFIPALKKMPCFAGLLPSGAARHRMKGLQVAFAGNILGFVGSNSPSQIGANRCRIVSQDEKDKFKQELAREAGAGYLANERTKGVPNSKKNGTSTPTTEDGPIWQDLMESDLRRRFLPCPHCNPKPSTLNPQPSTSLKGWFVLVKDDQYTVLPVKFPDGTAIPLAPLRWDAEAKRKDGTWDIDRVIRSARFECPHCHGHVRDEHRVWLDRHGLWIPTRESRFHRGYHLPSFYAPHVDFASSWGGMAKKFLDAQQSGHGMRGYINSDLAEVDASQEHGRNQIELASKNFAQTDWIALCTADFQKLWPFIWFVIRKWSAFKLQPPFPITNGRPDFVEYLSDPANAKIKTAVDKLHRGHDAAWLPIAELLRFDPRTGDYPVLDWLISQNIVGANLVTLFRDKCNANTLDLGRFIYAEMGQRLPRGGDSELIAAGHCGLSGDHAWTELAEIMRHHQVGVGLTNPNRAVAIDSGYAERHNPEVLRKCYESATLFKWYDPLSRANPPLFHGQPIHQFCQICPADNWLPMKGYPITKRWTNLGQSNETHIAIADPYMGSQDAGQRVIEVLEHASGLFWLRKDDLRRGRGGYIYSAANDIEFYPKVHAVDGTPKAESTFNLDEYQRHLNEQYYDERKGQILPKHGKSGTASKMHPYHLDDCETEQIALATHHGFFDYEAQPISSAQPSTKDSHPM